MVVLLSDSGVEPDVCVMGRQHNTLSSLLSAWEKLVQQVGSGGGEVVTFCLTGLKSQYTVASQLHQE